MAFSDLCHISNAFKTVENDADQSERIMEENAMVRDLITKILDETGPTDGSSPTQPPEKPLSTLPLTSNQYQTDSVNTSFLPPSYNYQDTPYNFTQNDQNGFNFNMQNGFGNNGFVNYENDVSSLLGIDPVAENTDQVTPEQLNLLRLAAQQIGGAQFSSPKYDEKYYNFFEPNQRNSLPETNMYSTNNFNRPNSLNLESFNSNYDNLHTQRYSNGFNLRDQNQDQELLNFLGLNPPLDRSREESMPNLDFKMPMEINGQYHNEDFNRLQEDRNKMLFNRNFQQMPPNKNFNSTNSFLNDRNVQNFDFSNQTPVSAPNSINYKPNGFHPQNDFMQRRDVNPMIPRDYQANEQRTNFENNMGRDNIQQQAALARQNQEIARQMNLLMRNRPPPNQLNVDVSFLHENTPFNLGLGALLGPNPQVPPAVLPSPMLDLPLLAPFYTMRNVRGAATASSVLHGRLEACYEQWRQLERERKRTEARLALAYPGRAVSSSNSIPVPRLPPCPTRVDRLTVDMLREHTKVLTLMGKMETLRASVTVAQFNKKPTKPEDGKITVLKRGQEVTNDRDKVTDPGTFDPKSWREDVKNLTEIAPHQEIENAMLAWRNAVAGVQAARRREMSPHPSRYMRQEPIVALSEAVKQLCICARRARAAMWCDLTLTVALAPRADSPPGAAAAAPPPTAAASVSEKPESSTQTTLLKPTIQENTSSTSNTSIQSGAKQTNSERKEEKPSTEPSQSTTKAENKPQNKQIDKTQQRRSQNYRKLNQGNYYQKNQRYDNRFVHRPPPYYLATGSMN